MTEAIGSLPRPILYAIVGAAAVLALLFATRRGGESSPTTPAPSKSQPATSPGTKSNSGTQAKQGSGGASSAGHRASVSQRTLPTPVKRALDAHKVVVLLFWNPSGSDDRSVKQSFDSVSSRGGAVAKFTDTLRNLSRYTRLTGTQAVGQTPTVVVVDRRGNGRFATGFQDSATVDQLVVDSLK
jgi:hypothetical protein